MPHVHIEIPAGGGPLLEVPASALAVADEANLIMNFGPFPGLPGVTVVTFTVGGEGTPVHCEIPEGAEGLVIIEVPPDAGLPVADEDTLTVLGGVPGVALVALAGLSV